MYKQSLATSLFRFWLRLCGHATANDLVRFLSKQVGKCSQSVKLPARSFCHFLYTLQPLIFFPHRIAQYKISPYWQKIYDLIIVMS